MTECSHGHFTPGKSDFTGFTESLFTHRGHLSRKVAVTPGSCDQFTTQHLATPDRPFLLCYNVSQ